MTDLRALLPFPAQALPPFPALQHRALLLLCLLAVVLPASGGLAGGCPMVRIVPERLPDLNTPRSGHSIFYAGGELTVVGGHTTNFVPTPTAEYLSGGKWHQLQTAYSHDNGFAVVMPSDEVIIGGGHAEELGVGQTFTLESYTPATHSFKGFGCLDRRRVLANATRLPDGRVIIAGNHYAGDAIGCYDGNSQVQHVKDVVQGHSNPYILPTANDNAIIIGGNSTRDVALDTAWADRVKGDAFRVPLLEQWRLVYTDLPFHSEACSIGDYSYLLTATDKSGQLAIVLMSDTCFTLLPTATPVPMSNQWGSVFYKGPVVVDRERQRGYVIGVDSLFRRQYVLAIDYDVRPSTLTLYYTDTLEQSTVATPVVTPDGDLILAGGASNTNYKPFSAVWLYRFATSNAASGVEGDLQSPVPTGTSAVTFWLFGVLALIAAALFIIYRVRRRRNVAESGQEDYVTDVPEKENDISNPPDSTLMDEELMERLCQFMDEQKPYLQSRLRQSDIAAALDVSTTSISDTLSACRNITFAQFIAEYRVRHAQQLLSCQPDIKLAAVFAESGFTSESTFFRTFKAVTGLSPKEWLAQQ